MDQKDTHKTLNISVQGQTKSLRCFRRLCLALFLYKQKKTAFILAVKTLSHLCEWLWSSFNSEFCVTEFTVAGVGGRQPLLQAALVHFPQRTGAVAGREQRLPSSSLMTDPTHAHITVEQSREDNNVMMINQSTV